MGIERLKLKLRGRMVCTCQIRTLCRRKGHEPLEWTYKEYKKGDWVYAASDEHGFIRLDVFLAEVFATDSHIDPDTVGQFTGIQLNSTDLYGNHWVSYEYQDDDGWTQVAPQPVVYSEVNARWLVGVTPLGRFLSDIVAGRKRNVRVHDQEAGSE